jgi:hypothetical protein
MPGRQLLAAALCLVAGSSSALAQPPPIAELEALSHEPRWRLLAVEYARSAGVSERRLVRGGAGPRARGST